MNSALRPRDIQARIRSGETAEAVAEAAQTTVEAIMPFAGPVLGERAHVAQSAQASSLRRRQAASVASARTLGEAASTVLSDAGVRDEEVEWDAWRRDDGRWTVVACYAVAGTDHEARFTYDVPGRYVVSSNDEGRILAGEIARPGAAGTSSRPLSAVPSAEYAGTYSGTGGVDELPLGDDAIELVRDDQDAQDAAPDAASRAPTTPTPPVSDEEETTDLSATVAVIRETPTDAPAVPAQDEGGEDLDEASDLASERVMDGAAPVPEPTDPGIAHVLEPTPEPPAAPAVAGEDESTPPAPERTPSRPASSVDEPLEGLDDEPAAQPSSRSAARRKGRSSVPSWEEIMFGGDPGE